MKASEIKFMFILFGFLFALGNPFLVSTGYRLGFQFQPCLTAYGDLTRDYWPTEGWQVSTPAAQNMSKTRLDEMSEHVEEDGFAIDSILIVRNGYIVFEKYLNPEHDQNHLHHIFSCTKSVLSALTGIAVDKRYIESVDQKILNFFPNQTFANPDPRKGNIEIRHLLTMTSGLDWHEFDISYDNPSNSYHQLVASTSWVQYVLDRPMVADPGEIWNYNTGDFHLLSALLQNATGLPTRDFATNSLFALIGIVDAFWQTDPQGIDFGGSGLRLSPRSMAKLGFLYLNNGSWDNQQLIPKDWIISSTSSYSTFDDTTDYCHGWWRKPDLNAYFALGYAGQLIFVVPQYDLVVVFTSFDETHWPYYDLLVQYVFSSLEKGADPLFSVDRLMLAVTVVVVPILVLGFVIIRRKRFGQTQNTSSESVHIRATS
ncbi:MAG: serine hydrolase [Candidatus Bathyarchaeota archaeon]|nr:MAG: serine hydrolase [Candidatus Bathyarchaeota archaeon]